MLGKISTVGQIDRLCSFDIRASELDSFDKNFAIWLYDIFPDECFLRYEEPRLGNFCFTVSQLSVVCTIGGALLKCAKPPSLQQLS
jgi:hypothetical protein